MTRTQILILASALLLIGLFGWQSAIELRAEEPRRAIVSIEMYLTGNFIVPEINGWSYYNKPPVFNWIMAGFFWLFGSMEEWVVRLPSLLSIVALSVIHYFFSKKYVSQRVALYSAFFYATAAEVLLYGAVNTGEIDPFYSLLVYLQMLALFHFHQQGRFWPMFLLSYALMALGFLVKGIPSIAFQGLTIIAMAIYHRSWKILFHPAQFAGLALFFALCTAYFYPYSQQDDLVGFLVRQYKEASQRTGLETPPLETLSQTLLFPLQLAKLLLPWSLLSIFLFRRNTFKMLRQNPLVLFSALFFIANIPIYWISGDFKPRYYYMFFPFLLLIFCWFFERNKEAMPGSRKAFRIFMKGFASLVPVLFIILLFIPEMQVVDDLALRVAAMTALGLLVAVLMWKSSQTLAVSILLMAVLRLGLNLFYMPAWQADPNVAYARSTVAEILKITGTERVYLYGKPYKFVSDASLGPFTFDKVELTTAPIITYRIPYYLSRSNKKVMTFTEDLIMGEYHLAPESMIEGRDLEILYRIRDPWKKVDYALVKP